MKNLWKKSIRVQITVLFLIIVFILTSLLTAILYNQSSTLFIKEATNRAYNLAEQVSQRIDSDEFTKIKTIEDEATAAYIKMREELVQIREIGGAKYVYTMRKTDAGDFMYVVDGSADEDFSHVGEIEESAPEYETAWSGEAYTNDNIFHDEKWGALLSVFYPLKNSDGTVIGIVGIDYNVDLVSEGLNKLKITCVIIMGVLIVIILMSGLLLSSNISKPLKRAVAYSNQMAALNLATEISEKDQTRKDELGSLAQSLHSIKESFRNIIGQISDSSEQLASTSREMEESSLETTTAIDEVSKTIEEIAQRAAKQAQDTETGTSKAVMLGNIIDNDIAQANTISNLINHVTAAVHEGLAEIEELARINEENNMANKTIADVISKTNDSAQKISQASNIISAIAEQTNLLALNASIEAARAGESGKGFAVVAEEIRKLADQSANSAKAIEQIVEELQNHAQHAVDTMKIISKTAKAQTESVTKSEEKYQLIDEAMQGCQQAVSALTLLGHEMVAMKNVILNTMEGLSAIAEENSAATEEVIASTVQQAASIRSLSIASEKLAQLAQDLQGTVSKFSM